MSDPKPRVDSLFTTLARVPRTYDRFRAGSLLDKGPLSPAAGALLAPFPGA